MEKSFSKKKGWTITQEAFDLLLANLDSDRDEAAKKYEHLRAALLAYFEIYGSPTPAEMVDDTFDRAAHNFAQGKEIYTADAAGYFCGIARNVLREWRKGQGNKFLPLEEFTYSPRNRKKAYELFKREREHAEHQKRIDCLEKCLSSLPESDRDIITQYYDGERSTKISNRKSLAERLHIPVDRLWMRALRIRNKLEACVEKCLSENL